MSNNINIFTMLEGDDSPRAAQPEEKTTYRVHRDSSHTSETLFDPAYRYAQDLHSRVFADASLAAKLKAIKAQILAKAKEQSK